MEDEKKEKSDEQKKIDELTETLKRLQAEFENHKKRAAKENSEFAKCASEQLVKKLLPVLDSFEQALKNKNSKEFVSGVELIYSQLFSVLKEEGLNHIDCRGKKFDPYCEEVLLQEEADKDNIVLEELQKGYTLNGKVIRTAKVKLGKLREEK